MSRVEVKPGDEPRQFYRLTPGKKIVVMLGGPTMNLLIYLVLTVGLLGIARHRARGHHHHGGVGQQVRGRGQLPRRRNRRTALPRIRRPTSAGLKPGDRIVAINGAPITAWDQAVRVIEASPGRPLSVSVVRDGAPITLRVTPVENVKYANASGTETKRAGFIGVSDQVHRYYQAVPLPQVPGHIVSQVALGLHAMGSYPSKIVSLWHTVFNGAPRDPNGAIGVVGIGRLGGDFTQSKLLDVQDKVVRADRPARRRQPAAVLLQPAAAAAARRRARRGCAGRGRQARPGPAAGAGARRGAPGRRAAESAPAPIYVDTAQMLPVMYAVASVLIVLTLLTLYADIVKPINALSGRIMDEMTVPLGMPAPPHLRPSSHRGDRRARSRSVRSLSAATRRSRCSR